MAKKRSIGKSLDALEQAQKEIAKRRVDAIRKMDIDADEDLRSHMLALDGFRKDIENIVSQLDEYISRNKIAAATARRRGKGRRKALPKPKTAVKTRKRAAGARSKPLPEAGTKLHGKYKGKEYWGDVTKRGVTIEGIKDIFQTMSAAAAAVTGRKTINGWTFWKLIKM